MIEQGLTRPVKRFLLLVVVPRQPARRVGHRDLHTAVPVPRPMLFLVDDRGVPSVARWVDVTDPAPAERV